MIAINVLKIGHVVSYRFSGDLGWPPGVGQLGLSRDSTVMSGKFQKNYITSSRKLYFFPRLESSR